MKYGVSFATITIEYMTVNTLFIVHHGESFKDKMKSILPEDSDYCFYIVERDTSLLTPKGKNQVRNVANHLASYKGIESVITSPITCAVDTAKAICCALNAHNKNNGQSKNGRIEPKLDPRLFTTKSDKSHDVRNKIHDFLEEYQTGNVVVVTHAKWIHRMFETLCIPTMDDIQRGACKIIDRADDKYSLRSNNTTHGKHKSPSTL